MARALKAHPEPLLEVHPSDAARVGLVDGAWAQVRSRRGAVSVKVQITERIRPGTVFCRCIGAPPKASRLARPID